MEGLKERNSLYRVGELAPSKFQRYRMYRAIVQL